MDNAVGTKVQLYVYDLSNGLAASLSPVLLGKQVPGRTRTRDHWNSLLYID